MNKIHDLIKYKVKIFFHNVVTFEIVLSHFVNKLNVDYDISLAPSRRASRDNRSLELRRRDFEDYNHRNIIKNKERLLQITIKIL